jgi:Cdc6-like AAA superfamily ATPase
MVDPEVGFTSAVIRDPSRFVGRTELIRSCIRAINSPVGLIAIYGKRGVGKSSLLRQVQQMALGSYKLAQSAGLFHEVPEEPRTYYTVYYSCDSLISSGTELIARLCNDQDTEDGFLRLVPHQGKELVEFTRSDEIEGGTDLKVVKWGMKGGTAETYSKVVKGDVVQTFRNHINSIITHQVNKKGRDGLLILLDEFDVIKDKSGLGSLIKSLSNHKVKFGICGIGSDLVDLIHDHRSLDRLLEQGATHVQPMSDDECIEIIDRAEELFNGAMTFDDDVKVEIASMSQGYPYFTQLVGKACVEKASLSGKNNVDDVVFASVLDDIKSGRAFPTMESAYQRAIGRSDDRQLLLHLLAEQPEENLLVKSKIGRVFLRDARKEADAFDIKYVDQLIPRLIDERFGPVLTRVPERQGVYEFVSPVFRTYVQLRSF